MVSRGSWTRPSFPGCGLGSHPYVALDEREHLLSVPSATNTHVNSIHAVRGGGRGSRCGSLPELRAAGQRLFPVVPMLLVTKQHGGCNEAALGVVPERVLRELGSGHVRDTFEEQRTNAQGQAPATTRACQWPGRTRTCDRRIVGKATRLFAELAVCEGFPASPPGLPVSGHCVAHLLPTSPVLAFTRTRHTRPAAANTAALHGKQLL